MNVLLCTIETHIIINVLLFQNLFCLENNFSIYTQYIAPYIHSFIL